MRLQVKKTHKVIINGSSMLYYDLVKYVNFTQNSICVCTSCNSVACNNNDGVVCVTLCSLF